MNLWVIALLGLVVGSFLNVVVHRLPRMLEAQWQREEAALREQPPPPAKSYHLAWPSSHCPHCLHPLRWWQNLPVLSFLLLRGRCHYCQQRISWQYPAVELCSMALATYCAWRYGYTWTALAWYGFTATLLCLAAIDLRTQLLPDHLTLPLLWAGLLASASSTIATPITQAVWGGALGYSCLWLIATVYQRFTHQQGMGHGDFKLLAALGAWLGAYALLPVVLIASLLGSAIGLSLIATGRLRRDQPLAFGPFLVQGAILAWIVPWQAYLLL